MKTNKKLRKFTLGVVLLTSSIVFANNYKPIKATTKKVKTEALTIEPIIIESLKSESLKSESFVELNEEYVKVVLSESSQREVEFLAEIISEYNIKEASDFDSRENEYTAVFKSNKGYARVSYDKNGRILAVNKHLKNIALSAPIAQNINEQYRDWVIVQNELSVSYIRGYDVLKTYNLTLQKGDQKKKIKVKG